MNEQEVSEFFILLDQASEALGKPAKSIDAKMMFLQILGGYGLANLRGAILAHLSDPERGRFVPTPADLKAQIEKALENDGRPSADEAWSIALQMESESATVVTTDEISKAWGVARDIMPDRTGARMAFRSAYERLCQQAREQHKRVHWYASLGSDIAMREPVLRQAAEKGLLGRAHVEALLPAPEPQKPMLALMNSIKSNQGEEALKKLKAMLAKHNRNE